MIKGTVFGTVCSAPVTGQKTKHGAAFVYFRIAAPRKDGHTELVTVAAFGELAAVAAEKKKGDIVVVIGVLHSTAWLDNGQPRSGISVTATEIT